MKKIMGVLLLLCCVLPVYAADTTVSGLEDLSLPADSFWNGSALEGSYEASDSFSSGTATLNNAYAYDATFMYSTWRWFAYSNISDTATSGFEAQYNAIAGGGQNGSSHYVVGYCDQYAAGLPEVTFSAVQSITGVYVTNNAYAYYSMLNGDGFAKKFEAGDWFKLTITGKDENGAETGAVDYLLADGTALVNTWEWVDLSGLGAVKTLAFSLTSSDTGAFGMNTPAYFCMDGLDGTIDFENLQLDAGSFWNGSDLAGSYTATDTFVSGIAAYSNFYSFDKEWDYSSWSGFSYSNLQDTASQGLDGQYMAIPGSGAGGSSTYAVAYCNTYAAVQPELTLSSPQVVRGVYVTNNNYAYYSMLNGDGFAKKFEAGDWFKLSITGKDESGAETGTVEFLLADGTEILDAWAWVDLSGLGTVKQLDFALSSSDSHPDFGMNTPAYFALDSLNDPASNDSDDDGDGLTENQGDCNDSDADVYSGADEICGDGVDQNCDGSDLVCATDDDDDSTSFGCFIGSVIGYESL